MVTWYWSGIPCFDRCQLIIAWMSKAVSLCQPIWSMAEYGRNVGQLRRRRRRREYAPTNKTAGHDNHEKINSWVYFSFLYEYGAPLGDPWGRRSSAKNLRLFGIQLVVRRNQLWLASQHFPALLVILLYFLQVLIGSLCYLFFVFSHKNCLGFGLTKPNLALYP